MGPRRPALRAAGARCERFDARSPRESRAQAPTEQTILRRTVLNGAPSIPVVQGPGEWEGVFFWIGSYVRGREEARPVVLKTVLPYSATVERRPVVQHVRFALADVDSCQEN